MDQDAVVLQLDDPLGVPTRNERRSLLASSAVSLAIVHAGLLPLRITAFGIEFNEAGRRALLLVFAGVVTYFMLAFLVYAATDFLRWRITIHKAWMQELRAIRRVAPEKFKQAMEDQKLSDDLKAFLSRKIDRNAQMLTLSVPASIARAVLEFLVPIILGIGAVWSLLCAR